MENTVIRRYETLDDMKKGVPVHVVWEITLACNLACKHCGSRAGKIRPDELNIDECFEVVEQLSRLGTREITIIGGEAFLKKDWLKIVEKITAEGIDCSMQTGGYRLGEEKILQAKKAGIKNIGISIDGLPDTHNYIRGKSDSFSHAINCLQLLDKHGIISSVNTVITNNNKDQLEELMEIFVSYGVKNWQIQIAVAMGNAADNEDLLLQPYHIKEIQDRLAVIYEDAYANDLLIQPGNNIGYFGPYEYMWRQGSFGYYDGCTAGHTGMGIEADGSIKGCPSLPTKDYVGGNIRDMSLEDIWYHTQELSFTRNRDGKDLWGFCKTCYYSSVCMAGCTWTSHTLLGKPGNNPFCYHRVTELEKKGLRERIRKVAEADGTPFDYGLFELVVEDMKGNVVEVVKYDEEQEAVNALASGTGEFRTIKKLDLCHGCDNYVHEGTKECHFCGGDVPSLMAEYDANMAEVKAAADRLMKILDKREAV